MNNESNARLGRLKWHSRRALLELDIVLERFWTQQGDDIDDASAATLARLLEFEDHELWEMVSGRKETDDRQLGNLIQRLRGSQMAASTTLSFTN